MIVTYNWKSFVIVYENEESLVRLQEVIKLPKHYEGIKIIIKQLDPTSDDYRPMLKQIKKSAEVRILLDCSFGKIEQVISQAMEIGLVTDYHNYIITSLVSEFELQSRNLSFPFHRTRNDSTLARTSMSMSTSLPSG